MNKPQKTYIIAEAGVNHNGDMKLAKELIDIAYDAKADAVKFQTFVAGELISVNAPQAEYQKTNTGIEQSQFAMVKALELSEADFIELYNYATKIGITFLSTGFDKQSLDFLIKECALSLIKIPSGEITNAPFLYEIGKYKVPLVLSTGMATLEEIEQALAVLAYGWSGAATPTSLQQCLDYYNTVAGKNILQNNITILQCVTEYPAPYSETNLNAMLAIKNHFGCKVGFSDHSLGIHLPIAAVAMGASIIEKHFTKDTNLPGPDHKASLAPGELKNMVAQIRDVEAAMGDGIKRPQTSEEKNIAVARRSIVASQTIKKGEVYTKDNITCKRPGGGISAMEYWDYIGKKCAAGISKDQEVI